MTLVIAHRGASRAARENTLPAFRLAGEFGADGVELDARLSRDGHLVVHHDPHVSDGRSIIDTDLSDLPDHVPTLSDALDACAGMFVNIEIKNDPTEPDFDPDDRTMHEVASLLTERGEPEQRWLISAFRAETVERCRRLLPGVRTAWLLERCSLGDLAVAAAAGHDAVHPNVTAVTAELVRGAHALGLAVNTWTCNDPHRIAELMAWGVDGICTDVPDAALAVRTRLLGST